MYIKFIVLGVVIVIALVAKDFPKKEAADYSIQKTELMTGQTIEKRTIEEIVYSFLDTPYKRGPLGENQGENIYRTDVFDCTSLVLTVAANYGDQSRRPEEIIKYANHYPPDRITYENRLHFSSYRNRVSPLFEDITAQIGGNQTVGKKIVLNKKSADGQRLIDIDWEQEIILPYIKISDLNQILPILPPVVGVAFIRAGDEAIGLDVRHEGFLIDGQKLIHASSFHGKVVDENFFDFLGRNNYQGVNFFRLVEL